MMKYFYLILGWLFFIIGVVGAFLPVLPTTIFMILALWAFSKSSEKLHKWLYTHKVFGAALQQWQQYRVIPVKAKILAVVMISLSMAYLTFFPVVTFKWTVLLDSVMFAVIVYILRKPSNIPHDVN